MKLVKKRQDMWLISICVFIILLMLIWEEARNYYMTLTMRYPFIAGFCKFAILATGGECLAQRILHGKYIPQGFGLLPKALIWGMLGIATTAAFSIFYNGTPMMLSASGLSWAPAAISGPICLKKVFVAFMTSFTMNVMFAPVLMVAHKLADMHINSHQGRIGCLFARGDIAGYLKKLDWDTMWNVVLCISVPFFWIPAHTAVFLLPAQFRVLVAAVLGAVLGLVLAWAAARQHKAPPPEVLL